MSAYDELGREIDRKDHERGEATDEARNFAMRVVAEFQKHLGAPEAAVHLLPAAEVLRGGHAHHTIGESVERDGPYYTLGLEIDFPRYVTGIQLRLAAMDGQAWQVGVDGTPISDVFTPQKDWSPFVSQVAEHLRQAVALHSPPDRIAFRSR